jgi:hypothetical protein
MTNRPLPAACAGRFVAAGPDARKIHQPTDAGEPHFRLSEIRKAADFASFDLEHLVPDVARLQRAIAKKAIQEIMP